MAEQSVYKQRNRQDRRAVLEADFSKGMMSTNGIVTEGYVKTLTNFTFEKDNGSLVPRPSLRPYQIIMPDMDFDVEDAPFLLNDSLAIKDVKECVENGRTYYQIVLGMLDDNNEGPLIFVTTGRPNSHSMLEMFDGYSYDLRYTDGVYSDPITAKFYSSELPSIHNVPLNEDPIRRTEFPVGSFAFGNSYYFFGNDGTQQGLFRTVFDGESVPKKYVTEFVEPKEPNVTESVAYGYNMLLGNRAYVFTDEHTAAVPQLKGILPYDSDLLTIMMTPKQNQLVNFRCYYDIGSTQTYDVVWEWRETTSADWTLIQKTSENFGSDPQLRCQFQPPAKDIMVRVVLYESGTEDVVKAIVVGFDFSASNYGAAKQLEQKVYDLSTSTGMESWNGRIVLWGLPEDPTILFISDYNEPSYFPYPNNIVTFDEPIIYAIEFMDSLVVFTTNKIYQVTSEDGNTWKSTVIQSHLSINPWDKHLIQTVRNMLYFKSGNYYYMMVPKAQSLTGELTLAPITTPITSFFDNFAVNVDTILRETYDFTDGYELITYYNFLDYEDIHNIYLYKFGESSALLHFDVIYNTVDRTWKVWVYESAYMLYPFKHNATETGLLGTTSLIDARSKEAPETEDLRRIVQVLTWDKLSVRGSYIPNRIPIYYDPDQTNISIDQHRLVIPAGVAHIDERGVLVFGEQYADIREDVAVLLGVGDYYNGFYVNDIFNTLSEVYEHGDEYFTFRNFQFLDTGYRDDEVHAKKRYRELQLQINNLDKKNIDFGMEFILDGAQRKIFYKYDVNQIIDELDPEYGIVYIDSTPYLETDLSKIDITNQWTIDQSLIPDITLWKVRIAISGKGSAPRFKLFSRNEKRFELLAVNWISRIMHMR